MIKHRGMERISRRRCMSVPVLARGLHAGLLGGFHSRRSPVHSSDGIVSSTSPLANEAGMRMLRAGGNAADAAIAAAAVLNVAEPGMTGLGGDAFCLFYDSECSTVRALNGSGFSPARATLEMVRRDIGLRSMIPRTSPHAVTVPGSAAAWVDVVEHFGSGRLSLEQVRAPAIDLADSGIPIGGITSADWKLDEEALLYAPNGGDLLKRDPSSPNGYRAPLPGEIYKNPHLAKTMSRLAKQGKHGFYAGPIAESIVHAISRLGGVMDLDDLKAHADRGSEITQPLSFRLDPCISMVEGFDRRLDLWEHPPNSQGIVALMTVGIMQQLISSGTIERFSIGDHNTPRYLHTLISCLKLSFADGARFVADHMASTFEPATLLSHTYLASRAALFDPRRAFGVRYGTPFSTLPCDTVYLAVTDREGNGCSFVNSVADRFGAMIIPSQTGMVLHCRGRGFSLDPEHYNSFGPCKRPYNTIIPALLTDAESGALKAVFGVMGGLMQPQGHVQVLLNMLLFGMNPQEALDAPRVCIAFDSNEMLKSAAREAPELVNLEDGISPSVALDLRKLGYRVSMVRGQPRSLFGRGQLIWVHNDRIENQRVYTAGSDPRGDGAAVAL